MPALGRSGLRWIFPGCVLTAIAANFWQCIFQGMHLERLAGELGECGWRCGFVDECDEVGRPESGQCACMHSVSQLNELKVYR
jgi:hypothetical protein